MNLTGNFSPDFSDQPGLPIEIYLCNKCEYETNSYILVWPVTSLSSVTLYHIFLPPTGVFSIPAEEAILSAAINYTNSSTVHFKLLPAYVLYTVGRFAVQCQYKQGSQTSGQTHNLTQITNKMVAMIEKVIQASPREC